MIEVVQHFLPYRTAEILDVVADAAGVAGYALMIPLLRGSCPSCAGAGSRWPMRRARPGPSLPASPECAELPRRSCYSASKPRRNPDDLRGLVQPAISLGLGLVPHRLVANAARVGPDALRVLDVERAHVIRAQPRQRHRVA